MMFEHSSAEQLPDKSDNMSDGWDIDMEIVPDMRASGAQSHDDDGAQSHTEDGVRSRASLGMQVKDANAGEVRAMVSANGSASGPGMGGGAFKEDDPFLSRLRDRLEALDEMNQRLLHPGLALAPLQLTSASASQREQQKQNLTNGNANGTLLAQNLDGVTGVASISAAIASTPLNLKPRVDDSVHASRLELSPPMVWM
jgi:hypothetical protein